jgi:hypothetical protein
VLIGAYLEWVSLPMVIVLLGLRSTGGVVALPYHEAAWARSAMCNRA